MQACMDMHVNACAHRLFCEGALSGQGCLRQVCLIAQLCVYAHKTCHVHAKLKFKLLACTLLIFVLHGGNLVLNMKHVLFDLVTHTITCSTQEFLAQGHLYMHVKSPHVCVLTLA